MDCRLFFILALPFFLRLRYLLSKHCDLFGMFQAHSAKVFATDVVTNCYIVKLVKQLFMLRHD